MMNVQYKIWYVLYVGRDTTFYNSSGMIYNINLLVARRDNTTYILKPGKRLEQPEFVSRTVIEKIITWLSNIGMYGYTQRGGYTFSGSGRAYGANMPYRARHTETIHDADFLFSAMGMFGGGPGSSLDFAVGLSYLTEVFKTMRDIPDVSGHGVWKPEVYKSKVDEAKVKEKKAVEEKTRDWVLAELKSEEYVLNSHNIAIVMMRSDTLFAYGPNDTIYEQQYRTYRDKDKPFNHPVKGERKNVFYPARDTIYPEERLYPDNGGLMKRGDSMVTVQWSYYSQNLLYIDKKTNDTIPSKAYQYGTEE